MTGQRYFFGLEDFNVPSKSNSHLIRFNPQFWKMIASAVKQFRSAMPWKKTRAGNPYWIDVTDEVKAAQETIAWTVKEHVRRGITGQIELRIEAWGPQDTDNLLKIIGDSIEDSGCIKNDRQVSKITIERHFDGKRRGFVCEVIEL